MNLLKIKSKFYQYTGIYLADREENEYLASKEFWKEFTRIHNSPDNNLSLRTIQGLLIGSWQGKYGFTRRVAIKVWMRRPRWFFGPVEWGAVFFLTLKEDIYAILRSPFKG
jgi:hypothetical protein